MSRAKSHQFWAATGEPMRPMAVRPEYLEDHGTHSTEPGNAAIGRCTDPPPGVEKEPWQAMEYDEQVRVRAEVMRARRRRRSSGKRRHGQPRRLTGT